MQIAYYQARISAFLLASDDAVLGELTRAHGFALEHQQRDAWLKQIAMLKSSLHHLRAGYILFEFSIPRMGKRADVVLVIGGVILVLEFKVGANRFDSSAVEQVHDYALDLKNFHRGSHDLPIVPVLVATGSAAIGVHDLRWAPDWVAEPVLAGAADLQPIIDCCLAMGVGSPIDFAAWAASGYQPTPTIVEAAQALYQQHGVEEIARSDAGARNLGATTNCIAEIIEVSKAGRRKAICLVTGVPGAGKTLAGLNVATKRAREHSDAGARSIADPRVQPWLGNSGCRPTPGGSNHFPATIGSCSGRLTSWAPDAVADPTINSESANLSRKFMLINQPFTAVHHNARSEQVQRERAGSE